jgi:hypothetical protein
MNLFRKILLVIAILIAIPLILAIFIKKEYAVKREITINKPQQEVFNYIRFLKNQDQYSYWVRLDPNMKKEFRGDDGTVGFVYGWDGNDEAGKGEQEIIKVNEGIGIDVQVHFIRPMEGIAYTPISTTAVSPAQTKVTWKMTGVNAYPFNFMNLFIDNMLGKDLDKSLVTLKSILEKK